MKPVAALFALLSLAACARDATEYPSLAERASEQLGFAEPAAPPVEPERADPALDTRIAGLRTRMEAIRTGFDQDAARAEAAARAARGQAVGSDAWLDAQTALAALDDWRAQATALASDAEELGSARAATLAPDYPALTALQKVTADEAARQSAAIGRIQATLPAA